jgi:hypothetical protein
MSVRKRFWKTSAGEERQAWLCDYTGQSGKRHGKTFARKKDADADLWLTAAARASAQALRRAHGQPNPEKSAANLGER